MEGFNQEIPILEEEEYPTDREELISIIKEKNNMIEHLEAQLVIKEDEEDEMIENFNQSTNILLERIKKLEVEYIGIRPQTAQILKDIDKEMPAGAKRPSLKNLAEASKQKQQGELSGLQMLQQTLTNNSGISLGTLDNGLQFSQYNEDSELRKCHNCAKMFSERDLKKHTISCYRDLVRCKKCGEEQLKSLSKDHLVYWRNKKLMKDSILGNDLEKVTKCLNHGFNINDVYEDLYNYSLVHLAIETKKENIIDLVLESKGININIPDIDGNTPQLHAIERDFPESIIEKLLNNKGLDIKHKNNKGDTVLLLAIKRERINLIERQLQLKANANDVDNSGKNAVQIAQKIENAELTELLLKYGGMLRPISGQKFKIRTSGGGTMGHSGSINQI